MITCNKCKHYFNDCDDGFNPEIWYNQKCNINQKTYVNPVDGSKEVIIGHCREWNSNLDCDKFQPKKKKS